MGETDEEVIIMSSFDNDDDMVEVGEFFSSVLSIIVVFEFDEMKTIFVFQSSDVFSLIFFSRFLMMMNFPVLFVYLHLLTIRRRIIKLDAADSLLMNSCLDQGYRSKTTFQHFQLKMLSLKKVNAIQSSRRLRTNFASLLVFCQQNICIQNTFLSAVN